MDLLPLGVCRYDACLKTIDQQLKDCRGMSEYPIYVKALIKRQRGEINESLQLFQAATCLNPHNVANLKQVREQRTHDYTSTPSQRMPPRSRPNSSTPSETQF